MEDEENNSNLGSDSVTLPPVTELTTSAVNSPVGPAPMATSSIMEKTAHKKTRNNWASSPQIANKAKISVDEVHRPEEKI